MCGIAGIVSFDGPPDETAVKAMSDALAHRGPDDEGTWTRGGVALGHRRLSIIDLGGSRQPMESADGRQVLVFNGEILNYRELRATSDYPYRTQGDTEVVLAQHAAHGDDAPRRLGGQFAYALHDIEDGSVVLVRDRMGILPLFYAIDEHRLIFASETSALLAGLSTRPDLDVEALTRYLGGRSVPSPDTLLAGVKKLRPGHLLRVDRFGHARETPYWQPRPSSPTVQRSPEEAVDALDRLLDEAVRHALVADVPVGAYLSGGVDSSLIAAKMTAATDATIHTFCAEFGDPRVDESPFARQVSDALGTTHHAVPVRPGDFMDLWPWLSSRRGAPLSEPADIAVFRLAQAAHEHVLVVLSGEGSDELFGGYPKYRYARLTSAVGAVPAAVRTPLLTAFERRLPSKGRRLGVALRALSEPTMQDRVEGWFAPFTTRERSELVGRVVTPAPDALPASVKVPAVRRMLLDDLRAWLPDNLLERGDRMTMAASVELRPPFLDRDVVDFALGLPPELLVRERTGKWLVKSVARRWVPSEIVDRPKVGFRVPLDAWFRDGLRDFAHDLVTSASSVTRGYLDPARVERLFVDHDAGRRDESIRIWTLASLEVWYATVFADARA